MNAIDRLKAQIVNIEDPAQLKLAQNRLKAYERIYATRALGRDVALIKRMRALALDLNILAREYERGNHAKD